MFKKVKIFYFFCFLGIGLYFFTQSIVAETVETSNLALDYQQKNDLQNQVKELFDREKYEELESLVSRIRENKERFIGGDWKLEYFYLGLRTAYKQLDTQNMLAKEQNFARWRSNYPNSVTTCIAWADYLKEIAWRYRGNGYADSVSLEGWKKFQEYLERIPLLFDEAQKLSEKDAHLYAVMITVGNAIGFNKELLFEYLGKGLILNPDYFPLYVRMTTILLPRWQGVSGEVEKFADSVLNDTQSAHGYAFYALIADKVRSYVGWNDFLKFNFPWDKIKKGFDELLIQYPANFYYLNAYAQFACIYKNKSVAKVLFDKIGNLWDGSSEEIWREKKILDSNRAWSLK